MHLYHDVVPPVLKISCSVFFTHSFVCRRKAALLELPILARGRRTRGPGERPCRCILKARQVSQCHTPSSFQTPCTLASRTLGIGIMPSTARGRLAGQYLKHGRPWAPPRVVKSTLAAACWAPQQTSTLSPSPLQGDRAQSSGRRCIKEVWLAASTHLCKE